MQETTCREFNNTKVSQEIAMERCKSKMKIKNSKYKEGKVYMWSLKSLEEEADQKRFKALAKKFSPKHPADYFPKESK